MKRIVFLFSLACTLFTQGICRAKLIPAKQQFVLNGIIENSKESSVYIRYVNGHGRSIVDSCKIIDGRFTLIGYINHPTIAFLTTNKKKLPDDDDRIEKTNDKNSMVLFLSPAQIQAGLVSGNFKTGKIKGSPAQTEFEAFNSDLPNSGSSLHHFIYSHPNSFVAAYLLSGAHDKLDTLTFYYSRFPEDIKHSDYGKEILEKIHKKQRVAVGSAAPHFSQQDKDGNSISLRNFKGKYVLMQFWSSTTEGSLIENRKLIGIYNKYSARNFTILGISVDGKKTKKVWEDVLKKDQLPWPQLAALKTSDNPVAKSFDVESIPSNFLIDPTGKIVAADVSADTLSDILEQHLLN